MTITETLSSAALLSIYSALALYALAFIAFTFDLARRATPAETATAQSAAGGAVASVGGGTTVLEAPAIDDAARGRSSKWTRLGMAFTVIGWLLNVAGVTLRGFAAGYAPWSNMFGFAITAVALVVGAFLLVQIWQEIRFLGAYITGLGLVTLGMATVNFYVDVVPLPPALQSAWLVIHVFVAILATSFFALGGGLSIVQLLQARREANGGVGPRFLTTLPSSVTLENMAYRLILVAFVFWTFTLIAGAVWAERAWGRYWGWDTKEVWTFIIWTIYAGYIHARATRGWRGSRSAWLAIIGFLAVVFNFTVVNLFFKGLHAYSGL